MINFRKSLCGSIAVVLVFALAVATAQADPLKLRLSVESTPGASTQHMLASFRDALKAEMGDSVQIEYFDSCLLYTSPRPRDATLSRMPSSA